MEKMRMKFISWNVNGLRACVQKGFLDYFHEADADIFCIQESKLQEGQIELELPGYFQYWNYAKKKGYSGTAVFAKQKPLRVLYGIGEEEHDQEGRVVTLEYENFYFVTVYTPNSQSELARLDYRMRWEDAILGRTTGLTAAAAHIKFAHFTYLSCLFVSAGNGQQYAPCQFYCLRY